MLLHGPLTTVVVELARMVPLMSMVGVGGMTVDWLEMLVGERMIPMTGTPLMLIILLGLAEFSGVSTSPALEKEVNGIKLRSVNGFKKRVLEQIPRVYKGLVSL